MTSPFPPAPSVPPPPPQPPPSRRTPALVAAVVALAVALFAAGGVIVWQEVRLDDLRDDLDRVEAGGRGGEPEPTDEPPAASDDVPDLGEALDDVLGDLAGGLLGDTADLVRCLDGVDTAGGGDVEGETAAAQVDAIATAVEDDRGLRFERPVEPEFLDDEAMDERVRAQAGEDYPAAEADLDERVLTALGAIPPGTGLRQASLDLLAGQVAGFYDPESGELVVRADDPSQPLDGTEAVTLSHELEHALADQSFRLPVDDEAPDDADASLAALALVEGDATLTMQRFAVATLDLAEQFGAMFGSGGSPEEALDGVPPYLASQLLFPYVEGLRFTCGLYAEGGWSAVDDAYAEPPATTAQVLFPERYRDGEAATDPDDPGAPGAGWEQARTDTFGAAELRWLLEAPGGDTDAALDDAGERVEAWGGGEYVLHTDGESTALGLALVDRSGGDGLCDAVAAWYAAAFPDGRDGERAEDEALVRDGDQDAVLRCDGDQVRLGIAPTVDVARRLVG